MLDKCEKDTKALLEPGVCVEINGNDNDNSVILTPIDYIKDKNDRWNPEKDTTKCAPDWTLDQPIKYPSKYIATNIGDASNSWKLEKEECKEYYDKIYPLTALTMQI